jgi:hypothetical protein
MGWRSAEADVAAIEVKRKKRRKARRWAATLIPTRLFRVAAEWVRTWRELIEPGVK